MYLTNQRAPAITRLFPFLVLCHSIGREGEVYPCVFSASVWDNLALSSMTMECKIFCFYQQTPGNTSITKGKENLCIERQPKHKVVDHKCLQAINIPLECPEWHFAFFSILPHTTSVHSNRGSISEGGVLQSKQKQRNQLEWSFIKGEECLVFMFQGTARNLGLFCDILIEIYFGLFP